MARSSLGSLVCSLVRTLVRSVYVLLPAYVANAAPVVLGGGAPVDGGRRWRGRRLLGDGKTWRGMAGGVLAGVATALALDRLTPDADPFSRFGPGPALALSLGTVIGDAAGSFCKRRAGVERGGTVPGLDQLGFVAGAAALTHLLTPSWARTTLSLPGLLVAAAVTLPLHRGTNALAYRLGLKSVPW